MKLDTDRARSHFHNQLGGPFNVIVVGDPRLAAIFRIDQQEAVGLRLVVEIEPALALSATMTPTVPAL